ncbi:hypothetical protein KDA23_07275 [Candidatus Saccharibacteria bacterium]|nr:hypothetical protein [Candidatus Saccharibacteria bacterium]
MKLFSKIPHFGPRGTKILVAVSAVIMSVTLVGFVALSVLVSNGKFRSSHGLNINPQDKLEQTNGTTLSEAASPGGGIATGVGGFTGTNSPVVTLTASPATVNVGEKATLKWSVTKNPDSCTASDDWSGAKATSGTEKTITLTKVQTYLFTITCKTATGTGFSTVSVGVVRQGGTGNIALRPVVQLAADDTAVYIDNGTVLTWKTTNNPTSCTASGSWSGTKSTAGHAKTGTLKSAKTFTYKLTCKNNAGTGFAETSIVVIDPPQPVVTIASSPVSPVLPGKTVKLSWKTTSVPKTCTASGDWSGTKSASGSQTVGPLSSIKTYEYKITCTNSKGGTFDSVAIAVIPNPPSVSLTTSPSSIYIGNSSTLTWSASNSPTACSASGDWSGSKSSSGTQSTGTLNSTKVYYYSLTCANAGGTGYATNVPVTVSLPPKPVVSISSSPISITSGSSSNISWSATNSPTSCVASGDWSGSKSSSGTFGTGTLTTVKTYSYTLSCSNAGGSDSATTTVNVSSGGPSAKPVVTISVSPASIGTGSSATISWSATNSPTSCTASGSWSGSKSASGSASTGVISSAGTNTYTLSCTNAVGTGSSSDTLTIIAVPVVSISVSPSSINTGSSSTISWNATNSPSSCTAGGSWSGSKGSSGTATTGTISTAGSYVYSLSCTNSGGTSSNSTTLTVTTAPQTYCSGKTPCYGVSALASHAGPGNCWGWNGTWVIDITTFRPSHPGGIKAGSSSTIENADATCNHDIYAILFGSSAIPNYSDKNGATKHKHNSSTYNNSGSSALAGFRVGYYDATKP